MSQESPQFELIDRDLSRSNRRRDGIEDDMTEGVRDAFAFARVVSRKLGHSHITSEHILLGLVRSDRMSIARRVLESGKLNVEDMGVVVSGKVIARTPIRESGSMNGMTIEANVAFEAAKKEAEIMGDKFIGTHHLILGLSQGENAASSTLQSYGIDQRVLRDGVVAAVSVIRGSS